MAHSTDGAAGECHGAPVYGHLDARAFFVGDGGGQRGRVLSFGTFVHNLTGLRLVHPAMTQDDDSNLHAYY